MRKDISLDPKATHYCKHCGLTMKPSDEFECSACDGDFCEPRKREKKKHATKVAEKKLTKPQLRLLADVVKHTESQRLLGYGPSGSDWAMLRKLEERGLVQILRVTVQEGRIYGPTLAGREAAAAAKKSES